MNYYKPGAWNSVCDICGRVFKSTELRRQYDNLMVCREDWSPRHPQEYVRGGLGDPKPLPWSRPESLQHRYANIFAPGAGPIIADSLNVSLLGEKLTLL